MKTYTLLHSHHEGPLLEISANPKERYDYILKEKPKDELDLRLALFAVVPDDVLRRYVPDDKAQAAYNKAEAAYNKAGAAYYKARDAYHKARDACRFAEAACDVKALHRDVCWPWCPGENIFARGTNLNDVIQAYEQERTASRLLAHTGA